jgi:hypothetical protein
MEGMRVCVCLCVSVCLREGAVQAVQKHGCYVGDGQPMWPLRKI